RARGCSRTASRAGAAERDRRRIRDRIRRGGEAPLRPTTTGAHPGRISMQSHQVVERPPDDPDTAARLAERIRKLRWLGMQQEAEELQFTLRRGPHTECVILVPRDTDWRVGR